MTLITFLEGLLGLSCRHRNVTWPRTIRGRDRNESYVRCNECGQKINFNVERWDYES